MYCEYVFINSAAGMKCFYWTLGRAAGSQMNGKIGQNTLEFIENLDFFDTLECLSYRFGEMIEEFGCEFFIVTGFPEPNGRFEDQVMLNAWPVDWFNRYIQENYIHSDPVAHECSVSVQPFSWCEVHVDSRRWPLGKRIKDEATEFGMENGLCVPIFGLHGLEAVVSVAGKDVDLSAQARASIHLASIYTHGRAQALLAAEKKKSSRDSLIALSGRERECLTWVAAGKSSWEISRILLLSENTVTGYLKAAAKKLGCVNRTHAVVEAIRSGQVRF